MSKKRIIIIIAIIIVFVLLVFGSVMFFCFSTTDDIVPQEDNIEAIIQDETNAIIETSEEQETLHGFTDEIVEYKSNDDSDNAQVQEKSVNENNEYIEYMPSDPNVLKHNGVVIDGSETTGPTPKQLYTEDSKLYEFTMSLGDEEIMSYIFDLNNPNAVFDRDRQYTEDDILAKCVALDNVSEYGDMWDGATADCIVKACSDLMKDELLRNTENGRNRVMFWVLGETEQYGLNLYDQVANTPPLPPVGDPRRDAIPNYW